MLSAWLVCALVALNAYVAWANYRKAKALDELAEEVLRDRETNLEFAKQNLESAASLSAFVLLHPSGVRGKSRTEA